MAMSALGVQSGRGEEWMWLELIGGWHWEEEIHRRVANSFLKLVLRFDESPVFS